MQDGTHPSSSCCLRQPLSHVTPFTTSCLDYKLYIDLLQGWMFGSTSPESAAENGLANGVRLLQSNMVKLTSGQLALHVHTTLRVVSTPLGSIGAGDGVANARQAHSRESVDGRQVRHIAMQGATP